MREISCKKRGLLIATLEGPYHLHHNKQRKTGGEAMGELWKEQEGKEDVFFPPTNEKEGQRYWMKPH